MPYPQFMFARRHQLANNPLPTNDSSFAAIPPSSDRIDPAQVAAAHVPRKLELLGRAAAATPKIANEGIAAITPMSLSSCRSQPIDIPQAPPPSKTAQPVLHYPSNYTYRCTLCWNEKEPPSYKVGAESRIVCLDCWRWIHSVSICWKCNEVVYRKEDAIGFGWC